MNSQRINIARHMIVEEVRHHMGKCKDADCEKAEELAAYLAACIGLTVDHLPTFIEWFLLFTRHRDEKHKFDDPMEEFDVGGEGGSA